MRAVFPGIPVGASLLAIHVSGRIGVKRVREQARSYIQSSGAFLAHRFVGWLEHQWHFRIGP